MTPDRSAATSSEKYQKRARELQSGLGSSSGGYWITVTVDELREHENAIAAALVRVEAEERERAAMMAGKCGYYGLAAAIRFRGTA